MKKLFLIGALLLSACTLPNLAALGTAAPAPLAATSIDETALRTAWQSFDVFLDSVNLLIDAGVIKPGSAKAIAIADGIDKTKAALQAAEHAAAAGSTTSYKTALAEASAAISDLKVIMGRK